jgi:hypothetical protein
MQLDLSTPRLGSMSPTFLWASLQDSATEDNHHYPWDSAGGENFAQANPLSVPLDAFLNPSPAGLPSRVPGISLDNIEHLHLSTTLEDNSASVLHLPIPTGDAANRIGYPPKNTVRRVTSRLVFLRHRLLCLMSRQSVTHKY